MLEFFKINSLILWHNELVDTLLNINFPKYSINLHGKIFHNWSCIEKNKHIYTLEYPSAQL